MESSAIADTPTSSQRSLNNPWNKSTMTTGQAPWNQSPASVFCSFQDVMSEQLVSDLQSEEETDTVKSSTTSDAVDPSDFLITDDSTLDGTSDDLLMAQIDDSTLDGTSDDLLMAQIDDSTLDGTSDDLLMAQIDDSTLDGTSDDLLMAQMLQHEFDREHDQMLKKEEQKYNGSNKLHPALGDDDEDDEDDSYTSEDELQGISWEKSPPNLNKSGITGKGKNITTKHDSAICGRRNATKMMEFPPDFEVGDGEGMDIQLPNHVYNKLKSHSQLSDKRSHRLHEKKEHSTAEQVVDPRTRLLLYKMINAGVLESISGSIATGKESVVFHACGGKINEETLPAECAIKVFKTTLNEFKNREKYVHGDRRFAKDDFKKQNPRKIIRIWAEKERANLNRLKRFNIPCPDVLLQRKHILLLSFIGENQKPAPKLKEAILTQAQYENAYSQVLEIMKTMYAKCSLVHGDLSEYNLLWFRNRVIVIDISQGVDMTHPRSMEFLVRDCYNISKFFQKHGVQDVPSAEGLFNEVTGLDVKGEGGEFIAEATRFNTDKRKSLLAQTDSYKVYPFDYFFEKTLKERETALQELLSDSDDEETSKSPE